jgi:hypothetical protein
MEKSLSEEEIAQVTHLLKSELELERLHALWILYGKDKLTADQLLTALDDSSTGIRENVLIMSEKYLNTHDGLLRKCLALTHDDNQRVRMQSALTLSTLNKEKFDQYKPRLP